MRLKLDFVLTSNEFLLEYRHFLIKFLKSCLDESNVLNKVYHSTNQKDFTYSVNLPNPKFYNDFIKLSKNKFTMYLSVSNENHFDILMNQSLIKMILKPILYNETDYMILKSIHQIKEKTIDKEIMLCKTLSPICIQYKNENQKNPHYYSFGDNEFASLVKEKTNLEFIPIDCKKIVVKTFKIGIESTIGTFALKGNKEDLKKCYITGFGNRKNQGFGMIEKLD